MKTLIKSAGEDPKYTTLAEIAYALRVEKRTITRRAQKEAWPYEEIPHPGKPLRKYPLDKLPEDVQQAIKALRALTV